VGIVTVNYRTPHLTEACVCSLLHERQEGCDVQTIVVDGGSADSSAARLAKFASQPQYRDWVEFLPLPINGGFGWANNQAILRLLERDNPPEYIHLLNPDSEVEPGAVRYLSDYLDDHPRAAAVGSQLLELDGSWTGSAFSFPSIRGELARGAGTGFIDRLLRAPPVAVETAEAREVEWATGASVMFRREALEEVGLFDEGFFLYHEEIELMWRMRQAGWTIATEPRSRVRHVGGGSTGVHSRKVEERLRPRRPHYWYRSRARFFGLTRGRFAATAAFITWIAGHMILKLRRLTGLAKDSKPLDHEFRDQLTQARPRQDDFIPAVMPAHAKPTSSPAWMQNRWL